MLYKCKTLALLLTPFSQRNSGVKNQFLSIYYFLNSVFNWAILGSSSFDFIGITPLDSPGEGDVGAFSFSRDQAAFFDERKRGRNL